MSSIPHGQQNELQANLLKLLEDCPFDETNQVLEGRTGPG